MYRKYGAKLHYYDVNSLYPAAMLNNLPGQFLGMRYGLTTLANFFGFVKVEVTCTSATPVLPVKSNGKVVYPTGT